MIRSLFTVFITLCLTFPLNAAASDQLARLEAAAKQDDQLQSGLETYQVTVETSKIAEMITQMTASMPADVPRPKPPAITKYWLRGAPNSLIVAEEAQTAPYMAQMIERFSSSLAVELEGMLLPANQASTRQALAKQATIKSTEVSLADKLLLRFEITFDKPTDLNQAFYTAGMRLPQKQVVSLAFDVDVKTSTISEMSVQTTDGLNLTAEIRYQEIVGGWLPERIQTTSLDGSVDDLIEVTFVKVESYRLPARMTRTLRRPNLQEDLDVSFTNYRINQPLPESVRSRLTTSK